MERVFQMKFVISSGYGMVEAVRSGIPHSGIDLAMPKGTELRSIAEGIVERIVDYGSKNLGKGVIIKTEDGARHIYGHMSDINVKVGERISVGESIGLSGNTGHSTGPHLHFAVHKDGEYVDPSPVIEHVDALAGDVSTNTLLQTQGIITQLIGNHAKAAAKDSVKEWVSGALEALGELLVELTYAITLVGGGILIILGAVGMQGTKRKVGMLLTGHVLIKYLIGGESD
jgi:hypothetical protein